MSLTNPFEYAGSRGGGGAPEKSGGWSGWTPGPPPAPPPPAPPWGGGGGGDGDGGASGGGGYGSWDGGDALPPLSFEAIFSEGWRILGERYKLMLGCTVLMLVVSLVHTGLLHLVSQASPVAGNIVSVLTSALLINPLGLSVLWLSVRAARRRPVAVEDLGAAFNVYWRVLGLYLLSLVATAVVAGGVMFVVVIFAVMTHLAGAGAMVALVLLLPAAPLLFYLSMRLYPAFLLAIDTEVRVDGVMDAVRLSWSLTADRGWMLVGAYIVLMVVLLGSMLLLVLPAIFFGMPFMFAAIGAAYAMLVRPIVQTDGCLTCGYPRGPGPRCPECGTEWGGAVAG